MPLERGNGIASVFLLLVSPAVAAALVYRLIVEPTLGWLGLALALALAMAAPVVNAWSSLTSSPGTVTLASDSLCIDVPSLTSQPVTIPRSAIEEVRNPPTGLLSYRVGGPAHKRGAALASSLLVTPNVSVEFTEPIEIQTGRRLHGLVANNALRPTGRRHTSELWFRLADDSDVRRLVEWARRR